MSSSLRHILISIASVLLAVLAHGRLIQAGWLGSDRVEPWAITDGYAAVEPRAWGWEGRVRPVPTLVHRTVARAVGDAALDVPARVISLRVTAFVVLLLGALTAGFALRRALMPWVGGDTARAGGFACALFIAVHPLAGAAVARPESLGMLCVWLFGSLAAFLFLRGRQMREKGWIVGAGVVAILAGFSSPWAWLIPFVLAAMEFGSARRPRPLPERLRTALTTLLIFTLCVFVESIVAAGVGLRQRTPITESLPDFSAWSSPGSAILASVEKLGLLFFPITGGSLATNWPSYLVCIAIVLIALWPVLRSARAAPRLWGSLAPAWIAAMMLALVPLAGLRIAPDDGSNAHTLMIAGAFAAIGLAAAATSLLGTRRIVLPALIAIGLSWLSARGASNYVAATDTVTRLMQSIAEAQRAVGDKGQVLVVDPPQHEAGFDLGADPLWQIVEKRAASSPLAVPAEAIPILTRTQSFAQWRAHQLAFLEKNGETSVPTRLRVIMPTAGTRPPVPWRGESRSKVILDLDPASVRFARIRPLPGTSTADAPRIAWRASEPAGEWVSAVGVWLQDDNGPFAVFDSWRHEAWWTASTIRRVSAEDPLVNVALFELLDDLPLVIEGGQPQQEGDDWVLRVREDSLVRPLRGTATFVLEIVACRLQPEGSIRYARYECEESLVNGIRELRARGAASFEFSTRWHHGRKIFEWSLERRVADVVIARASGNQLR